MSDNEIVSGQRTAWSLLKKLDEGDAGEVYFIESLVGEQTAILKRPRKSAFSGDEARQAAQIRIEAKVLSALASIQTEPDSQVCVPAILDQPKSLGAFNGNGFLIVEKAPGFDLGFLARVAQLGLPDAESLPPLLTLEEASFLDGVAAQGCVPSRVLLTILLRLINYLQRIHALRLSLPSEEIWGIAWNDVKAAHLFWDPRRTMLTVIDWGNAQFLEADGTTKDRKCSWVDDFRQLFEEMGRYLSLAAPELAARVGWPASFSMEAASSAGIEALKARLIAALLEEDEALAEARQVEANLLHDGAEDENHLEQIKSTQQCILSFGQPPDFAAQRGFAYRFAVRLVEQDRLEKLRDLCAWAISLTPAEPGVWPLVDRLAQIPGRSEGVQRQLFLQAIQFALSQDWESLLWNLLLALQAYNEPEWWPDVTALIREYALGPQAGMLRPLVALRRLYLALQALIRRQQDRPSSDSTLSLEDIQHLTLRLKEDILPAWSQLDPGPPHSSLLYTDVETLLSESSSILPDETHTASAALAHPAAQVQRVLEAWDGQDFLVASRGLRRLVLWDPDRKRALTADSAIESAPAWLKMARLGPMPTDNFPDWITNLEARGRELHNQVGPAAWLDSILIACRRIRRGAWPGDLLVEQPGLLRELPWLRAFERSEQVIKPEAETPDSPAPEIPLASDVLQGIQAARVGPGNAIAFLEPLDAWMPEARGSSARVLLAQLLSPSGSTVEVAVKLMRMDKVDYALPLFREEVKILSMLSDVPGVTRMLECGFLLLDPESQLPLDPGVDHEPALGRVLRIGSDSVQEFLDQLIARTEAGWTPYLALVKEQQADNLLMLCDAGIVRGQFLPVISLLKMAIQICDILEIAHERNIVYRDHKILHYYWQAKHNGIYIIDWNVARLHPEGLTPHEIHMDLVQFAARGLHHILTGRAAPGALPLGPTRPEEIEQSAQSYQAQWTYDDRRLSAGLRAVLERALAGEYPSARSLGDDLKSTMMQLPEARL